MSIFLKNIKYKTIKKIKKLKYRNLVKKKSYPYKKAYINSIYVSYLLEQITTLLMKKGLKKRSSASLYASLYSIKKYLIEERSIIWSIEINRKSRWDIWVQRLLNNIHYYSLQNFYYVNLSNYFFQNTYYYQFNSANKKLNTKKQKININKKIFKKKNWIIPQEFYITKNFEDYIENKEESFNKTVKKDIIKNVDLWNRFDSYNTGQTFKDITQNQNTFLKNFCEIIVFKRKKTIRTHNYFNRNTTSNVTFINYFKTQINIKNIYINLLPFYLPNFKFKNNIKSNHYLIKLKKFKFKKINSSKKLSSFSNKKNYIKKLKLKLYFLFLFNKFLMFNNLKTFIILFKNFMIKKLIKFLEIIKNKKVSYILYFLLYFFDKNFWNKSNNKITYYWVISTFLNKLNTVLIKKFIFKEKNLLLIISQTLKKYNKRFLVSISTKINFLRNFIKKKKLIILILTFNNILNMKFLKKSLLAYYIWNINKIYYTFTGILYDIQISYPKLLEEEKEDDILLTNFYESKKKKEFKYVKKNKKLKSKKAFTNNFLHKKIKSVSLLLKKNKNLIKQNDFKSIIKFNKSLNSIRNTILKIQQLKKKKIIKFL